jgi:cold shock CspA family protein
MTGRITRLSSGNGSGFITGEDGQSVYFETRRMMEYDVTALAVGQLVTFEVESGGRPKAINICVQKPHRPTLGESKHLESTRLRYLGFEQRDTVRAYRFERLTPGEESRTFFVTIDLALFKKHGIGMQEGPALCLHALKAEIDGAEVNGRAPLECSLTDREMLAHLASKPIPAPRSHPRRPQRPAGASQWSRT